MTAARNLGYTENDRQQFARAISVTLIASGWHAGDFDVDVERIDATRLDAVVKWPRVGPPRDQYVRTATFSPECDEHDAVIWATGIHYRAAEAGALPVAK